MSATPVELLASALADRYTIERELGQGGMATVYLAQDIKHDRKVAIKVLRPELAAALGAERFLSEIRTTAALSHPNILPLFDSGEARIRKSEVGEHQEGVEDRDVGDGGKPSDFRFPTSVLFYVMPYITGETLRDRLERDKQLSVPDAVRIASAVGSALDYAHRHGVVHRDIKPENILLHEGQALVADFGISLAVGTAPGSRMTETGMSLGTPSYMSPEQAMGEPDVGARSDIFALGCMLHEMLIGEPPFTGVTPQAIVAKIMTAQVSSLTRQRPTVPAAIDRAVHRALERVPADRFETAAEFVAALQAGESEATEHHGGRRRTLAYVAAGLVVAVLLALLFRSRGAPGPSNAASSDQSSVVAVLPFRNISQDTAQQYFSAGMTEEIAGQLSRIAALRVLGRSATASYDTVSNRLERMAHDLGVGSVVDGSVRLDGDRVRIAVELTDTRTGQSLWSEQYDRQLADVFGVQEDVAHQVASALQATLTPDESKRVAHAPTSNVAAYELYLRAVQLHPSVRSDNAVQADLLRQAIALDSGFAGAYAQLARNLMFRGTGGEPEYLDSALVVAQEAIALDPELADAHFALGDLQSANLRFSDARRSYLKALELSPSHPGAAADLANVYVVLGRYDEALDWALRSSQLEPNHIHAPYHVALALLPLGDDSASARFLLTAERKRPTELRVQGMLAWLALRRGDPDAALSRARRLVRTSPENLEGAPILAEIAVMTSASDAEQLIAPLAAQDPEAAAQMFPGSLRTLHALTLFRRGDVGRARALWQQSTDAAERKIKGGAEGPAAAIELAAIHAIEGDTGVALTWLERADREGWKDWVWLNLDPMFASIREAPRYRAVLTDMQSEVAAMRTRAAAAHPGLFDVGDVQ